MKRVKYILCLTALCILLQGCDSQSPQQGQTQQKMQFDKPAQHSVKRDIPWPPEVKDLDIELTKNLLAKNYYVILDGSGSMRDSGCSGNREKFAVAKEALTQFANIVPPDANLGLLIFYDGQIQEKVALATGNREEFISAVNSSNANGGTPLYSAIKKGYQTIERQAQSQLGYGEYILVTVTDGEAGPGEDPKKIVNWILDNSPVQIHTIGFCIGENHSLNIPGQTVYKPADSPDQLQKGLQDVLAEAEQFEIMEFK